jgi:hypothetical protein
VRSLSRSESTRRANSTATAGDSPTLPRADGCRLENEQHHLAAVLALGVEAVMTPRDLIASVPVVGLLFDLRVAEQLPMANSGLRILCPWLIRRTPLRVSA